MARTIVDWIIKCVALCIGVSIALSYWQTRDNGRYVYHEQPATAEAAGNVVVVDTRTGTLHTLGTGVIVEIHPRTGAFVQRRVKSN
jgi:hypothetical protein